MTHPAINVLFIDDDEDDYVLVRDLLDASTEMRYEIDWVSSYDDAANVISTRSKPYDLYLIDYFLGNIDQNGLGLLKEVRAIDPYSPVIFLTGKGNHEVDLHAMRSGATDYVVKDANLHSLLERSIRYSLEHTRTLRSLVCSQSKYQALFEQSNDAIFIVRLDSTIYKVNDRASDLLGYAPEALDNLSIHNLFEQNPRQETPLIFKRLLEERRFRVFEHTMKKQSNETFPAEINAEVVYDELDAPSHFQVIVRDVSERKNYEAQRLALELQNKRNEIFKQIITGFSHDLRTPLSIINVSLYLLEKLHGSDRHLEQIDFQINQLIRSIEDVLEIAYLNTINSIERSPTNIPELLHGLESHAETIFGADAPAIVFDMDSFPTDVFANASLLNNAFQRLVDNACRYTKTGSSIKIRCEGNENYGIVEIEDTGTGIEPDDLPYIFEPFYRADESRMARAGSSGLGLTIAQRVVELHEGTIEVNSLLGQGTCVRITLPFLQRDSAAMADADTARG